MWKAILFTVLAVGAFAQDFQTLAEDRRNQVRQALEAQCAKNGAADKVDEVVQAGRNLITCVGEQIDFNTLKNEVEEAKPKGTLDEVFKKYCQKTPQLKQCFHTLFNGVSACMDETVRSKIGEANTAIDQLFDFVCYKDGDRIALFIAEGGPECFQNQSAAIRECALKLHQDVPDMEAANNLTVEQQCAKYDELTACTVTALEECSSPTPGNMADSVFRYIRKESPCKKVDEKFF